MVNTSYPLRSPYYAQWCSELFSPYAWATSNNPDCAYASGAYKSYDWYNGNASTAMAAVSSNYQFGGSDITFCWASQACSEWLRPW